MPSRAFMFPTFTPLFTFTIHCSMHNAPTLSAERIPLLCRSPLAALPRAPLPGARRAAVQQRTHIMLHPMIIHPPLCLRSHCQHTQSLSPFCDTEEKLCKYCVPFYLSRASFCPPYLLEKHKNLSQRSFCLAVLSTTDADDELEKKKTQLQLEEKKSLHTR